MNDRPSNYSQISMKVNFFTKTCFTALLHQINVIFNFFFYYMYFKFITKMTFHSTFSNFNLTKGFIYGPYES